MIDNSKSTAALSALYSDVDDITAENKKLNPTREINFASKKAEKPAFNVPRAREFF